MDAGLKVTHAPRAVHLDGWPALAYVPRLGPGVRLAADPSVTLAAVLAEARAGLGPAAIAGRLGLPPLVDADGREAPNAGAIEQAIDYATRVGAFGG